MITIELKSHFLRLYQMAFSDHDFDLIELKMLYKFAEERGITKSELDNVLLNPSHETVIPNDVEKKIEYLYDLALMIWADDVVTEDELSTLKKYCLKFDFKEENIDELAQFLLDNAKEKVSKGELIHKIQN